MKKKIMSLSLGLIGSFMPIASVLACGQTNTTKQETPSTFLTFNETNAEITTSEIEVDDQTKRVKELLTIDSSFVVKIMNLVDELDPMIETDADHMYVKINGYEPFIIDLASVIDEFLYIKSELQGLNEDQYTNADLDLIKENLRADLVYEVNHASIYKTTPEIIAAKAQLNHALYVLKQTNETTNQLINHPTLKASAAQKSFSNMTFQDFDLPRPTNEISNEISFVFSGSGVFYNDPTTRNQIKGVMLILVLHSSNKALFSKNLTLYYHGNNKYFLTP